MHRASNGHCRVPTDFSGYTDTMAVWHIVVAELKPFGAKIGLEFILESFCLDRVEAAKKVRNIDTACYTYIHLSLVAYQRRGQVSCKWTIKCEGLSRIDRGLEKAPAWIRILCFRSSGTDSLEPRQGNASDEFRAHVSNPI